MFCASHDHHGGFLSPCAFIIKLVKFKYVGGYLLEPFPDWENPEKFTRVIPARIDEPLLRFSRPPDRASLKPWIKCLGDNVEFDDFKILEPGKNPKNDRFFWIIPKHEVFILRHINPE